MTVIEIKQNGLHASLRVVHKPHLKLNLYQTHTPLYSLANGCKVNQNYCSSK